MSGAISLKGLVYQQRYVAFRVLSLLSQHVMRPGTDSRSISEFSIEGWTTNDAPVWDVWIRFSDGTLDFNECKDTAIEKTDRLTFYARLRKEIAAGTPASSIRPVWVTDPDKQTLNALAYIEGIPSLASNLDLATVQASFPKRVDSVEDAVREAVFQLCHHDFSSDGPRPCTFEEARELLKQLRVDRHRFEDLDQAVRLLTTGVLARGTGRAMLEYVTGVLSERIVSTGQARFTIHQLLEAIGTAVVELEVEGRVRALLSFNAASGFVPPARLIRWNSLPGTPTTVWGIAERLPGYDPNRSCLVVAEMGIGKTVASLQTFEEEARRRHPSHVLRVEARSLGSDDLSALVRLACIMAGTGPTWLAIDGLDEMPVNLTSDWERAVPALTALPNLTLLATVRREVLAVREWLKNLTSSLSRLEIARLNPSQVEKAFLDAGLPVPANRLLVSALQNPFLLSLYADIVSPNDMPLAESGEVTAFRVVDEFWRRRVRGVSLGLRAVGDSEISQEPKRRAAVYLADRSVSGDLSVSRDTDSPHISAGIEMLLREGVIQEQGAGSVTWIHDWIREYAIVDRLVANLESATAVTVARSVAACQNDSPARVAAAGGVKWVVSNPAKGTPTEYLSELWSQNKGLAREALAVLLEGPISAIEIATLSDELLIEAITLTIHLGATQWGEQVESLPDERFFGDAGDELHARAVDYELDIVAAGGKPSADVVRRLVSRDLRRLQGGKGTWPKTFRTLLDHFLRTELFRDGQMCEWLIFVGTIAHSYDLCELLKATTVLIKAGEITAANTVFRSVLGFTVPARGDVIAQQLAKRRSLLTTELEKIIRTPGLLGGNPDTWGVTIVALLARLIHSRQKEDWPRHLELMAAFASDLGEPIDPNRPFEPNFDEDPRVSCMHLPGHDNPIVLVSDAVEQALKEVAAMEDPGAFHRLAGLAVSLRFAGLVVLPLLVLYDLLRSSGPRKDWHVDEAVGLLTDDGVVGLESLSNARRLLRRLVLRVVDDPHKEAMVGEIRRANLQESVCLSELADFQGLNLLAPEEISRVGEALSAKEIDEPSDPRNERLYSEGHWGEMDEPEGETGWPSPEEDGQIRYLMKASPQTQGADGSPERSEALTRQLKALNIILGRHEARVEPWLGKVLGWCRRAIEELRLSVEHSDSDGDAPRFDAATWLGVLDRDALWWREMTEIALDLLAGAVPASHADSEGVHKSLSWSSEDVLFNSLDMLDELLAIDQSAPFDQYQHSFAETVSLRWGQWPVFSRATALHCIRPWFWQCFTELRTLLAEAVRTESSPLIIDPAVRLTVILARSTPVPELRDFLQRTELGEFIDALREVSRLLGTAAIRSSLPNAAEGARELNRLMLEVLSREGIDSDLLNEILEGVLWGASDFVLRRDPLPAETPNAWLELVALVSSRWRYDRSQGNDGDRFPIQALTMILDGKWPQEVRSQLFAGIAEVLELVIRNGSLGDFCDVHFQLTDLITGGPRPGQPERARYQTLQITEEVEALCLRLCRASMERVALWRRQGKTTEDLGWSGAIDGRESVKLIKSLLEVARDRVRLKREVAPLVDVLADAGQSQNAADLRAYLRRI